MTPSIASTWHRIHLALAQCAPALGRALRPPLVDDALAAWLRGVGADAPALAGSYALHDGSTRAGGIFARLPRPADAPFTQAATWLSTRALHEERTRMLGLGMPMYPIGIVGPGRRLPAYEDNDDETHQAVLVEPKSELLFAATYLAWQPSLETRFVPLHITWPAYLDAFATELESGRVEACFDDWQILRLTERTPPAKSASEPRDVGSILLAWLIERRLIELSDTPSQALRQQIAKALRKRSAEGRLAALREAFDASAEVTEHYASDEELAALIAMMRGS